jgi:hypothetical protein
MREPDKMEIPRRSLHIRHFSMRGSGPYGTWQEEIRNEKLLFQAHVIFFRHPYRLWCNPNTRPTGSVIHSTRL